MNVGRGPAGHRRARRLAGRHGRRAAAGGRRPRRAARLGGLRRRRRRGAGRRPASPCCALPGPLPTPVLAFAVRAARRGGRACRSPRRTTRRRTTATRSTWPTAAQIVPPADAEIEAAIAACTGGGRRADRRRLAGVSTRRRHRGLPGPRRGGCPRGTARELRVALTPMHGVGGAHGGARAAPGRLHRRARGRGTGRAGPGLPDGRLPQPGGAGRGWTRCSRWPPRWTPTWRSRSTRTPTAARSACRPGDGWRMLTRRRDRRAARRPPAASSADRGGPTGSAGGHHHRLVVAARSSRRGARRALRRDAHRLQVDRPRRAGAGLRLRGGARLLRRPGRGARQGRHRGRRARLRPGGGPKAAGQGLPDRLDELAVAHGVHRTEGLSLRLDPAARDAMVERLRSAPPPAGRPSDPHPTSLVLPAPGRARGHPPVRHGTEAQGVPGGRRAGGG